MITPNEILALIDKTPPIQGEDKERNYLGASAIGGPCARKLWLEFHKYVEPEVFEPRMLRLFYRGHSQEPVFEYYLRESGFDIINNCTSQARFTDGFFSGAGDGVAERDGVRYALEYKTHNHASFLQLKKHGVRKSKPQHFDQCQINTKKFKCEAAIYLAVNKNDDEIYCEVIPLDLDECDRIEARAEYIITAEKPPERIASSPDKFPCTMCNAAPVCFGKQMPRIHCRNCVNSKRHEFLAEYICEDGRDMTKPDCPNHVFNPYAMQDMVGWFPVEFLPVEKAIIYTKGEARFINGPEPHGIESRNLDADPA